MRTNFLIKISDILLSKYKESLSDLAIVLPSRRSSVFMTQAFSKLISKPIWLPKFYSIDDFLLNINNLNRVNNLELFFDFFTIYKKHIKNSHDIERCYKWASSLLDDFNEIDKSCVEHTQLFNYLSDLKRIESWYLDVGSSTEEIGEYVMFFKKLQNIYKDLQNLLISKDIAYPGLSERLLADQPDKIKDWLQINQKQKIIFIGLDSLSISQEKIINYLLKHDLCDIFWDTDKYFIDDLKQESAKFLRKYRKKWPKLFPNISNEFLTIKKKIDIIGTTKNINQAKLLGSILKGKQYTFEQLKKVAIILPNENLLLSVLESIPEEIKDINITMGYKLSHHPLLSLFGELLNLYSNKKTILKQSNTEIQQYLKVDVLQLLQNSYFRLILDSEDTNLQDSLINQIKRSNLNYITLSDIQEPMLIENRILKKIFFKPSKTGLDLASVFLEFVEMLLELIVDQSDTSMIEQECLFKIEEQLLLFKQFIKQSNEKITLKLFSSLFHKIIKSIRLKFSGEPLNGIQIMGLLESRTIDFDEIFILSANESELPPSNTSNSFIPFDVKTRFNMRTALDMDLIYANHFFNLIKRPRKIHIIYNHDLSSSSSGERSRFINQLIYELKPLEKTAIKIEEYVALDEFTIENNTTSLFKKRDDYLLERLLYLSKKGFSPSSINLYNYCKRQFYFEKIIGVSERKELTNNFEKSDVGSIIHAVLYNLYKPYLNKPLNNSIMKNIQSSMNLELENVLTDYAGLNLKKGKNILVIEAIQRILKNYIFYESNLIKDGNTITIKFLEHEMGTYDFKTKAFQTLLNQMQKKIINLKGHIDRVDLFNNQYRIIDYKTGFIQPSDLIISNLSSIKQKPKVLQLLLYAWLFKNDIGGKNFPVVAGVINLRSQNFEFQKFSIGKRSEIDEKLLHDFENELDNIFIDMFDPKQSFSHDNRDENCRFCD